MKIYFPGSPQKRDSNFQGFVPNKEKRALVLNGTTSGYISPEKRFTVYYHFLSGYGLCTVLFYSWALVFYPRFRAALSGIQSTLIIVKENGGPTCYLLIIIIKKVKG